MNAINGRLRTKQFAATLRSEMSSVRVTAGWLILILSIVCIATGEPRGQPRQRRGQCVTSEQQLRDSLSMAKKGSVVCLAAKTVALTDLLVIDAPNVTIEGRTASRTVIRCPEDDSSGAIVIRGEGTILRSLNITRCRNHSAVTIDANPSRSDGKMEVTFEDVHFYRNGGADQQIFGAAVRSSVCQNTPCPSLLLRFLSCHFSVNRAILGGAIFAENVDVEIVDSVFLRNRARMSGGALYIRHSESATLRIDNSRFDGNKAQWGDKSPHSENLDLVDTLNQSLHTVGLGGGIFAENPASFSIERSVFANNTGCQGGGGIAVFHGGILPERNNIYSLRIYNSLLNGNAAFCGKQPAAVDFEFGKTEVRSGGSLFYNSSDETLIAWDIRNTTFEQNRAIMGGGFLFQSFQPSAAQHRITNCLFAENVALRGGGSFMALGTLVLIRSTRLLRSRAVYGGAISLWNGASLATSEDSDRPGIPNIIEGGKAIYGGGIMADSSGLSFSSSLIVRDNVAYFSGGGITTIHTLMPNLLQGIIIENNTALVGGGIWVAHVAMFAIEAFQDRRTIIKNNIANVGGGIQFESGSPSLVLITIQDTEFISNQALSLDHPEMERIAEEGTTYEPLPSAAVQRLNAIEQLKSKKVVSLLTTNTMHGHGGGICMNFLIIAPFVLVETTFRNILAINNTAIVGGGMSIHMLDQFWNQDNRTSCLPAAFGIDTCQKFDVHNATVIQNQAELAGGIFLSLPDGVAVSCSPEDEKWIANRSGRSATIANELLSYCSNVSNNTLVDGSDNQAQAATRVVSLFVEGGHDRLEELVGGEPLTVPCPIEQDATGKCPLRIIVKDAFNQTIRKGIDDASLELTLASDAVVGDLRYTAVNGTAVIENTRAWGIDRNSTLTIVSERDRSIGLVLKITTRKCYPGEIDQVDVCNRCPVDQYSFVPSLSRCQSCELDANCTGGAALAPVDGYWHSTPFSPVFRKCIFLAACSYAKREENLTMFYEDAGELQEQLDRLDDHVSGKEEHPDFSEVYPQCAPGYEGLLCGSCRSGYGHSYTGECESCQNEETTNGLFIFITGLWLFFIVGINCGITMMSANTRVEFVKHEQQSEAMRHRRQLFRLQHINGAQLPSANRAICPDNESSAVAINADESYLLTQRQVSTIQWTETLKILINYLQVTTIALHLQLEWTTLLKGLLRAQGAFVGLASNLVSAPYECNFSHSGTPASIAALWMRLATPWIVQGALILTYTLFWLIQMIWQRMNGTKSIVQGSRVRLFTCVIIIFIVSMYFSYIDVVSELLRAVNCVEIDSPRGRVLSDHPYVQYATESVQHVWAEDTRIVCLQGSHLPVAIIGFLGLFLSFCWIIWIIVWLPLNRKNQTKTEFISRYWFLYQAYRKEWYRVSWESTILLRKALISAVIVFSVHLGPTLQATLCAGILLVAQTQQSFLSPFNVTEHHVAVPEYFGSLFTTLRLPRLAFHWIRLNNAIDLNILETASLACSSIVFFSAIVLHDPRSSGHGRMITESFAFTLNLLFLLYVLYRLYAGIHVMLDYRLEIGNPTFMALHQNGMGICSLVKKGLAVVCLWKDTISSLEPDNSAGDSDARSILRRSAARETEMT